MMAEYEELKQRRYILFRKYENSARARVDIALANDQDGVLDYRRALVVS